MRDFPAGIRLSAPAHPVPLTVLPFFPPPVLAGQVAGPGIGDQAGLVLGTQFMDLMWRRHRMVPGLDAPSLFHPAMPDSDLAGQHAVDLERRMLVKRIGEMRGEKEQPEIEFVAGKKPASTNDLTGHQTAREALGHPRPVKNLVPTHLIQIWPNRLGDGC